VILYPTDTLWALGCDATNPEAVEKLIQLKKLDKSQGFILLADSVDMIMHYVDNIPPRIDTLMMYHSRPLSVIYEKGLHLPENVCAPDGSVAFRLTRDPFTKLLIQNLERPLVATGACEGYLPLPTTFGGISSNILESVDAIARYRRDEKNVQEPSQLVRLDKNGELEFIRE
ncbi:MAG: L-threonylcarbamoyladenylate synthase, partial [Saprospiraceae bacterium]